MTEKYNPNEDNLFVKVRDVRLLIDEIKQAIRGLPLLELETGTCPDMPGYHKIIDEQFKSFLERT